MIPRCKRSIITHKIISNFVRSYGAVGKANVQNAMHFVAKNVQIERCRGESIFARNNYIGAKNFSPLH
ncbi:hypothetical protein COK_1235 [Mannheimia haemolytica serotype A2 str. BOVINE]|nr:hypothetical protein COK_1235 [Mannheimia haemolytica serotype A2 str. BOVINE]